MTELATIEPYGNAAEHARDELTLVGLLASRAVQNGIAELGDEYRTRTLKDDTSLALKIAEREAAGGAYDTAAREAITVLDERVQLYARKFRGIAE